MGSRIMHVIIANQIADTIQVADKKAFILGGIAPDAVAPKDLSHFFEGDHSDYTRYIAYDTFYEKYGSDKQNEDYILGYYSHLIADDLWLKGFFVPWLKNRLENNKGLLEQYHHDFQILNGKLLDYYSIKTDLLLGLENVDSLIDLEEVPATAVKKFIPLVMDDMNYDQKSLTEKLNVFTFEQIIGYMETSIQKGIFAIKSTGHLQEVK